MSRAPHLWIVCKVIDNFGDAGVCWRLARQLAAEHPFEVSLIIDGEAALAAIEPSYAPTVRPASDGALRGPVQLDGVDILPWQAVAHARPEQGPGPDIVISAFGCELPGWLRRLLGGAPRRPLWLNLEYLSAEPWIDDCHQLVSIKPDDEAREHFFYPGFSPRSGGLIRERSLAEQRDRFRAEGGAERFLAALGAPHSASGHAISLFCYPQAPLGPWLQALATGPRQTLLCVAGGCAQEALTHWWGSLPPLGQMCCHGRLGVLRLPMLSQADYDRLLWSCELNIVRGEDSWVRAHWAEVPFIWQPYRQDDDAHRVKLEAFLDRMAGPAGSSPDQTEGLAHVAAMMRAWSDPSGSDLTQAWQAFEQALPQLDSLYQAWGKSLENQPDLAASLARYCLDRI